METKEEAERMQTALKTIHDTLQDMTYEQRARILASICIFYGVGFSITTSDVRPK